VLYAPEGTVERLLEQDGQKKLLAPHANRVDEVEAVEQ
jgi:hypothetical protein